MSEQIVSAVDLSAIKKQSPQQDQTWVNQSVADGASTKFQVLLNGPSVESAAQPSLIDNNLSVAGKDIWDDVFHREELMRALTALSNVQPQEIPAAAAKVTMLSLDMQMKVDAVRQGSRSSEESIQSMLRA